MKVYVAAPYGARDEVRQVITPLFAQHDLQYTSSWLDEEHEITPGVEGAATDLADATVEEHVEGDFNDIHDAQVLLLFTAAAVGKEGGGGRHVETGYALALGMTVVVVGEPENVFHRGAPRTFIARDTTEAVALLAAMQHGKDDL